MSVDTPNGKGASGSRYWKSLDELAEAPAFRTWVEREFPEGASMLDGGQRRNFMKVMAASFGLAGFGMTGCRRPEQAILPYGKSPEEVIPGIPNYYSTSLQTSFGNVPLIVESHQSRPTKIEGNPSYLPTGGGTDVHSQATVLSLYDPDRAQSSYIPVTKGTGENKTTSWTTTPKTEVVKTLNGILTPERLAIGKVAVLAESSSSPSRAKLASKLRKKGVIWSEYDPINSSTAADALGKALSTNPLRSLPILKKAKRILSLDCDFLGIREPDHLRLTREFTKGRKVLSAADTKEMNRLYSVESDLTLTGAAADHRLRLSSSQMVAFASSIAAEVLSLTEKTNSTVIEKLKERTAKAGLNSSWCKEAATDLVNHKGESLVVAGNHLPEEVHVLAYAINQALEANGKTVKYTELPADESSDISKLAKAVEAGEIATLIFIGGNPAFSGPSNLDWAALTKKVDLTIRFGSSIDETSEVSNIHIGASHYLESWGDGTTWDLSAHLPIQPLIEPLFATYSELDFLAILAGEEKSSHSLVQETFKELSDGSSFDDFLRIGLLPRKVSSVSPIYDFDKLADSTDHLPSAPTFDSLEVLLVPDFHAWDGRYANNGWMLECPDPISKLTWDNAILISPVLAAELEKKDKGLNLLPKPTMLNNNGQVAPDTAVFARGKQDSPVVKLTLADGSSIEGPLHVQPGLADYSLIASLGMGRRAVGRVGEGTGYDGYALLGSDSSRITSGVKLTTTKSRRILANVQEHWSMEGRAIVREANAEEYSKKEGFASEMGAESHSPLVYGREDKESLKHKSQTTPRGHSAYEHPDHTYEKSEEFGLHQWGMSIDLNLCTGCNACVVACQSENNIPVVGKDQVLRGREMHWIRLDRYFSSTEREGAEIPSDVQVNFQGVACMHCETAPCEQVCPVNATVHDEEGLNAMAYNRCVGTRYCANNCPYKVRRFNFFDWNKRKKDDYYLGPLGEKNPKLPTLAKNPDVSVRMRGVMEKCTYCVQRIQEAKIHTKVNAQRSEKFSTGKDGAELDLKDKLKVPDGTIKTACQQVCPADAIEFGDISDPESEVSKLKNNPRDYSVLGYLDTRPRTTFMARIRNPNPQMPDATDKPYSSREYHDRAHPSHDSHSHEEHGKHPSDANGNSDH